MLRLNNGGDTIVEVLIALAVLGFAFAVCYTTVDGALRDSQNSQEHSEALAYINEQLEALKYVAGQPGQTTIPGDEFMHDGNQTAFCLTPKSTMPLGVQYNQINTTEYNPLAPVINPASPLPPCLIQGNGFYYSVSIEPNSNSNNVFDAYVTWPGLGNLGTQQEEVAYRVYNQ